MYQFKADVRAYLEACEIPLGIYQKVGHVTKTLLVSNGFCALMHQERQDLMTDLNQSMFINVHPDDKGKICEIGEAFAKHEMPYHVMYRVKGQGFETYHVFLTEGYWQTMDNGEEVAFLYYTDMNVFQDEMKAIDAHYFVAENDYYYIDKLTGLPNLNYFQLFVEEYVARVKREGLSIGVAYINVDRMSAFNIRYGYDEGNALLKRLAMLLKTLFAEAFLVKMAGDHFLVIDSYDHLINELKLLPEKLNARSLQTKQRLHIGMSRPLENHDWQVGRALNEASYASKNNRGEELVQLFNNQIYSHYIDQLYILENFEQALKKHYIQVYYQPIVKSKSQHIYALEALARWHDPHREMLAPAAFIPILEEHHLIHKLNMYMAKQVLKEIPKRREAGLKIVPASVNFSADDFETEDFPEELSALVEQYHASPWMLIVEITERALPKMPESFKNQIIRLRAMGFQIWVDDFGSGYSSLNILNKFPLDLIKIDREFIKNYSPDERVNNLLVEKIVEVARFLKIKTLVEGVETEAQHQFLSQVHCEFEQGFLYAKPISLEEIIFARKHVGVTMITDDYAAKQANQETM